MATKKQKQPIPQQGYEFTGWATFNWGVCHQRVFRTRKQAQEWCVEKGESWENVKSHFIVKKVKCIVL